MLTQEAPIYFIQLWFFIVSKPVYTVNYKL